MNGSIRKRGKNSWELTVDLGRDGDGRRLRKFVNVRGTKAAAQSRLRELVSTLDKGLPLDNTRVTMAEFLDRWYRDYVVPNTRPRTVESYEVIIRRHLVPPLGSILLAKLQPAHIQRLEARLLDEGKSARTVLHVHRVLSKALRHAVRWGLVWRNPAEAVEPPHPAQREIQVPSAQGVWRILQLARRTPYHAAFHFLVYTGCRRSEALGVRWEDVDWERGTAAVVQAVQRVQGKGIVIQPPKSAKSRRAIALDADTLRVLRAHRAQQLEHRMLLGDAYRDHGLVFAGPFGEALDPSVLTHTFERLAPEAGARGVRLHDLRHFHATLLLQAGAHPKVVQERLGHATISITLDTYSHVVPSMQQEAAGAFAEAFGKRQVAVGDG